MKEDAMRTAMTAMIALAMLAASSAFGQTNGGTSGTTTVDSKTVAAERGYHYWLHPKQGMVKVDRKTHAMLVPQRRVQAVGTDRAASGG
jgi:hypothetical protein